MIESKKKVNLKPSKTKIILGVVETMLNEQTASGIIIPETAGAYMKSLKESTPYEVLSVQEGSTYKAGDYVIIDPERITGILFQGKKIGIAYEHDIECIIEDLNEYSIHILQMEKEAEELQIKLGRKTKRVLPPQ